MCFSQMMPPPSNKPQTHGRVEDATRSHPMVPPSACPRRIPSAHTPQKEAQENSLQNEALGNPTLTSSWRFPLMPSNRTSSGKLDREALDRRARPQKTAHSISLLSWKLMITPTVPIIKVGCTKSQNVLRSQREVPRKNLR